MNDLTHFQKTLIFECVHRGRGTRLIYNGKEYHLHVPRLDKKIEVSMVDIEPIVAHGYAKINQYGGVKFNLGKCDEMYESGIDRKRIPNPDHPGKMIDYQEYLYEIH